jgi:SAM-dependent methyltransferase
MRPGDDSGNREHPHWRFRDRVLDNAGPIDADTTFLDVGCGEGLLGFGALERGAGRVVFSDISRTLLDFCEDKARELGVSDRCRFVEAPAEDLSPIESRSVDVAATRSVLIYVADKAAAFRELGRVLGPRGRISLFEPINRFSATDADTWAGYDLSPIPEIFRKIRAVYDELQPPGSDPMLDFDERDLLRLAEAAGFFPVALELSAEIRPARPTPWDDLVSRAGNPRIPSLGEAMERVLTATEREQLTSHLHPLVEAGDGVFRVALAYLWGAKGGAGLH